MIVLITALQIQPSARVHNMCDTTQTQCRMCTGLGNHVQRQSLFQNSKIKISQWLLIKSLIYNIISYFLPGPNKNNDNRVSAEITQQLQTEFMDMFNSIGCYDGTFSLQIKPGSKP